MVADSDETPADNNIDRFVLHATASSITSNPLHGAELIQQLLKLVQRQEEQILGGYQQRYDAVYTALNELAEYLYGDDMILHFDDKTYSNMNNVTGLVKKLDRWVKSNYIKSEEKKDEAEE